jgi:DNA-3-methyladenine glycosylase II
MSKSVAQHLRNADPVLGRVIRAVGPYRLRATPETSPFRHLVRAIAHQQLNGTAANTILSRFVALFPGADFPTPAQVLAADVHAVRTAGFSFAKIAALKDLAARTLDGLVPDTRALAALDDAEIIERVTQVRGIGRWTVEMMLMFQLGRRDVLPVDDFGVRNGFRLAYGLRGLAQYGTRWAPQRTAAAWYLWRAVELAREGRLPRPPVPRPRIKTHSSARARAKRVRR